ncbi:MAG: cyclic nucleotide-binding domain-containing protein [Deltaproteobacteria bacterium]|nr:cyclic nucleotide-binding domain-containing protein [Deltaproteobacteria bacterium]
MISTVEKVLFLKGVDLFSAIPGEDLSQIAQIADEVEMDSGETIFKEGDLGDSLYLIVSGKVRIHRGDKEIAVLGEKQVFGEMALLDSEPRSASVTATTDVSLLKITQEDFADILAEKGEIAQGIIKVLTRRLRGQLTRK